MINPKINNTKLLTSEHIFRDKTVSTKSIAGVLILKKVEKFKQNFLLSILLNEFSQIRKR